MTYWIASTNRQNWNIIQKQKVWGIPKRHKTIYARVNKVDYLLIFVSQQKDGQIIHPSVITGAYQITDKYEDMSPLFSVPPQMRDERFPFRFKIKPVKIFKEPVEIKPLIPELGFVTNITMWYGHFKQAMREIPEEDYQRIVKLGKE